MMTITVDAESGERMKLSIQSAVKRLAADFDPGNVLRRIGRGEQVAVRLQDGTEGLMYLAEHHPEAPIQSELRLLAHQPDMPEELYEVSVQLRFAVEATIYCAASDPKLAIDLVDRVLSGESPVPASMKMLVNADDIAEQYAAVEQAVHQGDVRQLPLLDFQITRTVPCDLREVPA